MSPSPSRLGPGFLTWLRDDPRVRESLLEGKEVEATITNYAENDFLLEFLMGSGLWEVLTSVRPAKLRKENGKPWRALNGLEILRELSRVDRIAHCGRVISDTRLMMIAGFNAEEIRRRQKRRGLVVDPETLSNHLLRMSPSSVVGAFYRHVALLLEKKWIGRGIYAADAHEITFPHAQKWEGMGTVGKAHGYKLLLLVRISPGPERIAGFALGPLQVSEHLLLRMVLRALERGVCPVRRLIDILVLDRGYWGAQFLLGLRKKYGFHFVTRAQHEGLGVVKDVEGLLKQEELKGPPVKVREDRSHLGEIEVRLRAFEKVTLFGDKDVVVGKANVVVADETDLSGKALVQEGKPRPRFYYVTSLPAKADPHRIRRYYLERWVIENQGFRNLTQRWSLDIAPARKLGAIVARIVFVLVLANAEMIVNELFPGPWQKERERLGKLGVEGLIGGEPGVAAYTPRGQLGILSLAEYRALVAKRERQDERDSLIRELRAAQARGEGIEDILRRLSGQEP